MIQFWPSPSSQRPWEWQSFASRDLRSVGNMRSSDRLELPFDSGSTEVCRSNDDGRGAMAWYRKSGSRQIPVAGSPKHLPELPWCNVVSLKILPLPLPWWLTSGSVLNYRPRGDGRRSFEVLRWNSWPWTNMMEYPKIFISKGLGGAGVFRFFKLRKAHSGHNIFFSGCLVSIPFTNPGRCSGHISTCGTVERMRVVGGTK